MNFYEESVYRKAKCFDRLMEKLYPEEEKDFVLYDEHEGLEIDIEGYFDAQIFQCKWVASVESEVDGQYYRKILGQYPTVRIDRLIKTKCGKYVGVELKAGGSKFGRPLNQLIDYSNSKFWSIRNMEQVFFPEMGWLATFPMSSTLSGPVRSVVEQHRFAMFSHDFTLKFGSNVVATIDSKKLSMSAPIRKVGSR